MLTEEAEGRRVRRPAWLAFWYGGVGRGGGNMAPIFLLQKQLKHIYLIGIFYRPNKKRGEIAN